jgi:signal transduction histidine kinase
VPLAEFMTSSDPKTEWSGADWSLVLSRDGTVLAAADGAPRAWIGLRLAECADAPDDVQEAGRALLEGTSASPAPVAITVPLRSQRRLHLTVVEAMPVRRITTDLRRLLPSTLEVLARQAKSLDVALTIDIQKDLDPISLDAEKIAWVVTALVGNALRYVRHGSYTRPGGTVTVRATCSADAREVTIETQDDGPGIPPDALRTLSADQRTGTRIGLGLSMVREAVVAHGGTMAILTNTDDLHRGTTIRIRLPVVSSPVADPSSGST